MGERGDLCDVGGDTETVERAEAAEAAEVETTSGRGIGRGLGAAQTLGGFGYVAFEDSSTIKDTLSDINHYGVGRT